MTVGEWRKALLMEAMEQLDKLAPVNLQRAISFMRGLSKSQASSKKNIS